MKPTDDLSKFINQALTLDQAFTSQGDYPRKQENDYLHDPLRDILQANINLASQFTNKGIRYLSSYQIIVNDQNTEFEVIY